MYYKTASNLIVFLSTPQMINFEKKKDLMSVEKKSSTVTAIKTVVITESIAKAARIIYHDGMIFSKQLALMMMVLVLVNFHSHK
jgi:hypothetical protein